MAKSFILNTGAAIPSIGLGTWQISPGVVEDAIRAALQVSSLHQAYVLNPFLMVFSHFVLFLLTVCSLESVVSYMEVSCWLIIQLPPNYVSGNCGSIRFSFIEPLTSVC